MFKSSILILKVCVPPPTFIKSINEYVFGESNTIFIYSDNFLLIGLINARLTKMLYSNCNLFMNGLPKVPILQSKISSISGLHLLINCECSFVEIYFGLLSYLPEDILAIDKNGMPLC